MNVGTKQQIKKGERTDGWMDECTTPNTPK